VTNKKPPGRRRRRRPRRIGNTTKDKLQEVMWS